MVPERQPHTAPTPRPGVQMRAAADQSDQARAPVTVPSTLAALLHFQKHLGSSSCFFHPSPFSIHKAQGRKSEAQTSGCDSLKRIERCRLAGRDHVETHRSSELFSSPSDTLTVIGLILMTDSS